MPFALRVGSSAGPTDPWLTAVISEANGAANLSGVICKLKVWIGLSMRGVAWGDMSYQVGGLSSQLAYRKNSLVGSWVVGDWDKWLV